MRRTRKAGHHDLRSHHRPPGLTVDDFNKVNAKTNPPQDIDGLISWAAGTDASGLHVVAVWESQAHADRYADDQLIP